MARGRRSDARDEPKVRDESWALIHVASAWEAVLPSGPKEISELIGCAPEDLTALPFGFKSKMWMSRSAQISDTAEFNKPASHALYLAGMALAIRGPVVVHHAHVDWEEERRAEKRLVAQSEARRKSQLAS